MQHDYQAVAEHDQRSDAGQARKGLIHWRWLILALSIGFQVGMFFQHKLDKRVMAVMQNTIDEYDSFILKLESRTKRQNDRTLQEDLDAAKRIV